MTWTKFVLQLDDSNTNGGIVSHRSRMQKVGSFMFPLVEQQEIIEDNTL